MIYKNTTKFFVSWSFCEVWLHFKYNVYYQGILTYDVGYIKRTFTLSLFLFLGLEEAHNKEVELVNVL